MTYHDSLSSILAVCYVELWFRWDAIFSSYCVLVPVQRSAERNSINQRKRIVVSFYCSPSQSVTEKVKLAIPGTLLKHSWSPFAVGIDSGVARGRGGGWQMNKTLFYITVCLICCEEHKNKTWRGFFFLSVEDIKEECPRGPVR